MKQRFKDTWNTNKVELKALGKLMRGEAKKLTQIRQIKLQLPNASNLETILSRSVFTFPLKTPQAEPAKKVLHTKAITRSFFL